MLLFSYFSFFIPSKLFIYFSLFGLENSICKFPFLSYCVSLIHILLYVKYVFNNLFAFFQSFVLHFLIFISIFFHIFLYFFFFYFFRHFFHLYFFIKFLIKIKLFFYKYFIFIRI